MPVYNKFIDPKTKEPLYYDKERAGLFSKENQDLYYPVINGIPRFVSKEFYKENCQAHSQEEQTGRSFGEKWCSPIYEKLGTSDADYKSLEEQFKAMLGCESLDEVKSVLKNAKTTLNGGCGVAWSEYLFDFDSTTERHCIDLSLAVEAAKENTSHMKNITISQASILELPYPDNMFDVVYSCGVVHHTPDPKGAVLQLASKVKPGGILGIYIYCIKPLVREMCDEQLRKTTTKMSYDECMKFSKQMTMLGKALSDIGQPLLINEDIELLGIKAGKYDLQRFVYDYLIKCWYNAKHDEKYADLVNLDWYHPSYASHHTKEEVEVWLQEAGFNKTKLLQPPGWKHSGFFISGKKNS